jgi:hypothetical protein
MDTDPVAIAPCYSIFVGMNNTVLQNTVATEGDKGGFFVKKYCGNEQCVYCCYNMVLFKQHSTGFFSTCYW